MLQTQVASVFEPLVAPSRYKGAFGGRGSAKSWFFAEALVKDSIIEPGNSAGEGLRSVCIREQQKSLKESAKRLIEDKIQALRLGLSFNVFKDRIETPGDGIIIFQGMQDYTAESIKSLEGYKRAWIEEAQTLSDRSLTLLRPTIRADGSEMWFSWNPRRKTDAVDKLLRNNAPFNSVVVRSNWRNNPWFPKELELERLFDKENYPDRYEHIWEGDYATTIVGAYYAECIAQAHKAGRIGAVPADPLMSYRAYWDIGGTGAKADRVTIWIVQFIGLQIRVLDYYEARGQDLATHVAWLREWKYDKAFCILPHDGVQHDKVYDVTYESALKQAGFDVKVIKNQGPGAASMRIEAGRRLFGSMWFNAATTKGGLDALGAYHEQKDEIRDIGLGPNHDWASDGADSFGLMAIDYKPPMESRRPSYASQDRGVI